MNGEQSIIAVKLQFWLVSHGFSNKSGVTERLIWCTSFQRWDGSSLSLIVFMNLLCVISYYKEKLMSFK
uniref:Ovule protein n=1 Tax=Romanomermis culicivorax TaxID=13658 RepID=A0A915L7X6_ROMCU